MLDELGMLCMGGFLEMVVWFGFFLVGSGGRNFFLLIIVSKVFLISGFDWLSELIIILWEILVDRFWVILINNCFFVVYIVVGVVIK